VGSSRHAFTQRFSSSESFIDCSTEKLRGLTHNSFDLGMSCLHFMAGSTRPASKASLFWDAYYTSAKSLEECGDQVNRIIGQTSADKSRTSAIRRGSCHALGPRQDRAHVSSEHAATAPALRGHDTGITVPGQLFNGQASSCSLSTSLHQGAQHGFSQIRTIANGGQPGSDRFSHRGNKNSSIKFCIAYTLVVDHTEAE
jgi:hypothetical protein